MEAKMLTVSTGRWDINGRTMVFGIPPFAETARLLIVAPSKEEVEQIEHDQGRLTSIRSALIQVQSQLWGAAFHQPTWGVCKPESVDILAWMQDHNIPIIGGPPPEHYPMLDRLALGERSWGELVALMMNGLSGELVTIAFVPRPGVEAFLKRTGNPQMMSQVLPDLKGFDWHFTTFKDNGQTINSQRVYSF